MKKRKAKFYKGNPVQNLEAAAAAIEAGEWLYLNNKVLHPSWLMNMSLFTLSLYIRHGRAWYAEKVEQ